jgi:FdrA protein
VPVFTEIRDAGGPQVIVYVLGTEQDPQGYQAQKKAFEDAGVLVTQTAQRAALAAAAIASRKPEIAAMSL